MTITTNNIPRNTLYRHEVPEAVLADQFDYLDDEEADDGFFQYRGVWYHLSEFMVTTNLPDELQKWHGYKAESFSTGVLVRLSNDCEQVTCASYCA